MSKHVVLKSFAELALALRLEALPDEPMPGRPCEMVERGNGVPTVDIDHLMRDLEAACGDFQTAVREDEAARAEALQDLERYDALVAALRQAEAAWERAAHLQADAERLAHEAFTGAAREAAQRAVSTAEYAASVTAALIAERQAAIEQMASHLDLARLLAERQRQQEALRQQTEAAARDERTRDLVVAVQQAIAEGRLEAALALLANAKDFESPELTWLRDQVTERICIGRTWAAEQALRLARRTRRHDPAQAVHALETLKVDLLPEALARQVFGEWARACLNLCRERGIEAPLRYAPQLGRGAVLAWDEAQQTHVVVSALGLGPEWAAGQRVDDDVARHARSLI